MPKAIPVLESNIDFIVAYADNLGLNLDYLTDSLEDTITYRDVAGKQEVLYLITDGSSENNNVTFTEMTGTDFDRIWTFTQPESPTNFAEIKKV